MTLYDLSKEYLELLEMAEDPEMDQTVFADTVEALEGTIEVKVENYGKVIKQLKSDLEGVKSEIDRLTKIKKRIEASDRWLKDNLTYCMNMVDKRKFKTELFSFNIQKNPVSVKINDGVDVTKLPDRFTKITREENKTAIREAIENGEEISFAHLEQTEGVRIR